MQINVNKDKVEILENQNEAHEGEYLITKCYFTFDDFINEFQVKRAIFTIISTGEMVETDIINNECDIPSEVLKHEFEKVKLGVYAYDIDENEKLARRASPSYATFTVPTGSYEEGAETPETITPTQYDIYSAKLQEGLDSIDDKIEEIDSEVDSKFEEIDGKIDEIDQAIEDVNQAIDDTEEAVESTNNLNIDVSDKVGKDVTVTLTKKDGTEKSVVISDGNSLEFMWQGTSLGIKTDTMQDYVFVNLQGIQGQPGPQGEPFRIKKTYTSVAEMNADFDNMNVGDYVMIASSVEVEDNAKLYVKGDLQWIFITDFSGAQGIRGETGLTPNIQIGTVVSGSTPSVSRTGTNENPVFNFVLQKGDTGSVGPQGATGPTGNGIASITKTASAGLIDTYTITYTNGTTSTFEITNGQDGEVTQEYVDEQDDQLRTLFNVLPKVSGSGESVTLENTGDTMLYKMDLKGNTSQEVIAGETGDEVNDTSIYVDDVDTDKENYITLEGNTYQETTSISGGDQYDSPSPDYPRDIEVVTGNNTIKVEGKNLFDKNNANILNAVPTTPTINSSETGKSLYIPIKGGNTYTISKRLSARFRVATTINVPSVGGTINIEGNNYNYLENNNATNLTITTYSNSNYLIVFYYLGSTDTLTEQEILDSIQIEQGSTATTYEAYQGASYQVNLGKNLINELETGNIDENTGQDVANLYRKRSNYISVESNTSYTLSCSENNIWLIFFYYDASKTFISSLPTYSSTGYVSNVTPNNCKFIRVVVGNTASLTATNIQLEKGNQATSYAPYFTPIELCKIGTYQDRIYKSLVDNNWYVHKEIGKAVLNGSENDWSYPSANRFNLDNYINNYLKSEGNITYLSNYYKAFEQTGTNGEFNTLVSNENYGFNATDYSTFNFRFKDTRFTNVNDFKTWLSTHNINVYYILETPTETQITDTTLVNQLEALYTASIHTITHINTETSNLLPYIDLKYNKVTASPSPDRASEVKVVTGNNAIKIQSKNLFNTATIEQGGFNYHTGGNYTSNEAIRNTIYNIKPNTQYTISCNKPLGECAFCCFDKNENSLDGDFTQTTNNNYTFTTNSNTSYIKIRIGNSSYPKVISDSYDVQLEQGSQATSYVPYQSQTFNVNLGNLEFCKIGDYQDYIYYDKSADKWYKYGAIGKTTDVVGSTSITINDMVNNSGMYSLYGGTLSGKTITYDSALLRQNTIYYPLSTPTTTKITNSTLIAQLNELKKAMSYYDKTLITQTNASKPFILDVVAIRDLQDLFELISGE